MKPYLAAVIDRYCGKVTASQFETLMLIARRCGTYDGVCFRVTPMMLADAIGDKAKRRTTARNLDALLALGVVKESGRRGWVVPIADSVELATHDQQLATSDQPQVATHDQQLATSDHELATSDQPSISTPKVHIKNKSKGSAPPLDIEIATAALADFNELTGRKVTSKKLIANAARLVKTDGATLDQFRAVNRFKFTQLTELNAERDNPPGRYIDPATFWRKDKWEKHVRDAEADGLLDDAGNFIAPKPKRSTSVHDRPPEERFVVTQYGANNFAHLVERVQAGDVELDWLQPPALRAMVDERLANV